MSNHLEQIVRPSQSPSIRPGFAAQIYSTPKVPENEPIVWGSSGESVFELKAHAEATVTPAKWPETQRTFDVVRVFNKDDHEQYVDTEVMTEYQGRNKISQDRITMKYATDHNDPNTEVISKGNVRKSSGSAND